MAKRSTNSVRNVRVKPPYVWICDKCKEKKEIREVMLRVPTNVIKETDKKIMLTVPTSGMNSLHFYKEVTKVCNDCLRFHYCGGRGKCMYRLVEWSKEEFEKIIETKLEEDTIYTPALPQCRTNFHHRKSHHSKVGGQS